MAQIESAYFEVKELQEAIRSELGSSGLDFATSMALQELYDDVRELQTQIVKHFE